MNLVDSEPISVRPTERKTYNNRNGNNIQSSKQCGPINNLSGLTSLFQAECDRQPLSNLDVNNNLQKEDVLSFNTMFSEVQTIDSINTINGGSFISYTSLHQSLVSAVKKESDTGNESTFSSIPFHLPSSTIVASP